MNAHNPTTESAQVQAPAYDASHDRADHAYWAHFCTCGQGEWERTGHYPEHDDWCDVPSPIDDEE